MANDRLFEEMTNAVIAGLPEQARELAETALCTGIDPLDAIEKGFKPGMDVVGEGFAKGELFIPDLMMSGEAMKAAIAEIAALTTKRTNADARVAIKTLHYAALRPESSLETCFEKARRDTVTDMIVDLSDGVLLILWAAASSRSHFAKDIYARYCRASQDHQEKPFSYVHFYSTLSYLQSAGLVGLIATKVGRAYTKRVMLTFDEDVLRQICQLRFEQ